MKAFTFVLAGLVAAVIALSGCAKNSASAHVDTAPLEQSFKGAEPSTQSTVDKTVAAIKSGDFATAGAELKTLAQNAKLTPEQQQAVKDVMAQVETAMSETATKAASEAQKSVDNLKQSLPK